MFELNIFIVSKKKSLKILSNYIPEELRFKTLVEMKQFHIDWFTNSMVIQNSILNFYSRKSNIYHINNLLIFLEQKKKKLTNWVLCFYIRFMVEGTNSEMLKHIISLKGVKYYMIIFNSPFLLFYFLNNFCLHTLIQLQIFMK